MNMRMPILSEEERRRRAADLPNMPGTPGYVAPAPQAALPLAYQQGQQVSSAVGGALKEGYRTLLRPLANAVTSAGQTFDTAGQFTRGVVGADPAAAKPLSLVQNAEARTGTTKAPGTAVVPPVILPENAKQPVNALAASDGMYRTLTGPSANTALTSDIAGSAAIQGRFLRPDGTRGPQETRAYTQGGLADAANRVNVVPSAGLLNMMVDPGGQTASALSDARKAAADRGDFAAVERSYADTPEKKAAYNQQAAETKILNAVGNAPLSQLPQVAQAVTGIGAGRTAAAAGEQTFQKSAAELQQGQQIQAITDELFSLDPTKPESAARKQVLQEQLQQSMYAQLAAQGKTPTQTSPYTAFQPKAYDELGSPIMAAPLAFNKTTGQFSQPQGGGAQGGAAQAAADAARAVESGALTREQANERLIKAGYPAI